VLRKGEQLAATAAGGWQIHSSVNTEEITDWKNGLFNFDNADLPTVMRQLARWYDVEIEFKNEFPGKHIQGAMHRDLSLDQVLQLLTDKDVHFTVRDRIVIVSH
jgi:ferric-dicitrate binding protein FerR (iron transport regulator)